MELEELKDITATYDQVRNKIVATKGESKYEDHKKQYNPNEHEIIADKIKRPDKQLNTNDGNKTVYVSRIAIPFQKHIVSLAATFLCGRPIELVCSPKENTEKDMLAVITKTWDDNKLDYESKGIAKAMMSETECAELWYNEPVDENYWKGTPNEGRPSRLRPRILSPSKGDRLYPVYNKYGDMIAFARGYEIKVGDKTEAHFDIYTETTTYIGVQNGSKWNVQTQVNMFGKIPVIYYKQDAPEWDDVQSIIERIETLVSNLADSNDYFGAPMVFVEGEITGFSAKTEQGKVLEGKNGAKAYYLTWDQAPESVKLEYNTLRSLIMDLTCTPDISIEQMKSLGAYSSVALRMLFLGAHLKASEKEEIFGKCIQRRINFFKSAMAKINLDLGAALPMSIKPKFEYFLPKNEEEMINMLSTATGGGKTMSQKTAVRLNPLVEDPEKELNDLRDEGVDAEMK